MVNNTFTGSFTSVGETIVKKVFGIFEVVNEETEANVILNPSENANKPIAVTGIITNKVNGVDMPIPNVRVSFIKDYVVNDKTSLKYTGNRVILDWDMTDKNGKYIVFVEPGIYTIRVDGGKCSDYYTGQVVEHGLDNEYYYTIEGLIQSRCEDTLTLYGTDKRLVSGIMVDEYGKPVDKAEIIISQGEDVIAYIKTDSEGKYRFGIENGVYDVRIRAKDESVTITRNFSFENDKGFFTASPRTIDIL